MANNPITLLQDVINEVAGNMSLPTTQIYAKNLKGFNEVLNLQAETDAPFIVYPLELRGSQEVTNNGKVYLSYAVDLFFLDYSTDEVDNILSVIRQMHKVAAEFKQRIIRTDAYIEYFENQETTSNFQEQALFFDAHCSGVQLTLNIKINPNIITPSC